MQSTINVNVREIVPLISPRELRGELPMTPEAERTVVESREAIRAILSGEDSRLLAVVGPCSIHDEAAAIEYAERLAPLAREVSDRLLVAMRVYFEKPRTTVGWKGLVNDPYLDDSFNVADGLRIARRLLLRIAEMGLPAASEMLDPITPQYIAGLLSWGSIGARTTESQTHRQMASGLSMPIGYKNATDGNLQIAVDAMQAARAPHAFLGIDEEGRTCVVHTLGNPWGHLILRGGRSGSNYAESDLKEAAERLYAAGLAPKIMIDCSHANSGKDYRRQNEVWRKALAVRAEGNANLMGLMLESNLCEGSQSLPPDRSKLKYGVSITDACVGWDETRELLLEARETLANAGLAAASR